MKGTSAVIDDVDVDSAGTPAERLEGYVQIWVASGKYGFIAVKGVRDIDNRPKQWHFHLNSLMNGVSAKSIAQGVLVRFTPAPCPAEGKRDKATEIEVVG